MNNFAIFIGESGVGKSHVINRIIGQNLAEVSPPNGLDETTKAVSIFKDKYIDTPGINGMLFTTYLSDIKSVSVGNNVMIVLVLPHHLTRINSWVNSVESILDHFNEKKLVVVWNSKLGTGMEMSASFNEKFHYPIFHLDASTEDFPILFSDAFNDANNFMQWTEDISTTNSSTVQSVNNVFIAPRLKLINFNKQLDNTEIPGELKSAIRRLCKLHKENRQHYDDLKIIGDADLRHIVARYLYITKVTPIQQNLAPFVRNEGVMKEVYETFIKPFMIDDFWKDWNSHSKCDFVEALIALNFGQVPATFLLAHIGIKGEQKQL